MEDEIIQEKIQQNYFETNDWRICYVTKKASWDISCYAVGTPEMNKSFRQI